MWLLLGALFLAAGIIYILNRVFLYEDKRLLMFRINLCYLVITVIGVLLIFTGTVHGIWLGLALMIGGYSWTSFKKSKLLGTHAKVI